jgi:hypothetical protein
VSPKRGVRKKRKRAEKVRSRRGPGSRIGMIVQE